MDSSSSISSLKNSFEYRGFMRALKGMEEEHILRIEIEAVDRAVQNRLEVLLKVLFDVNINDSNVKWEQFALLSGYLLGDSDEHRYERNELRKFYRGIRGAMPEWYERTTSPLKILP